MFKPRYAQSTSKNKGIMATMFQVLITAAVIYGAVLVVMAVFQRSFLYYPGALETTPAQSGVPQMQTVRITTEDGLSLLAWVQPPHDAAKPWVVIFHGNAGTLAGRAFKARRFLDAGYGALLVEYRGYGGNPGSPTEAGLFSDARAALVYLAGQGVAGKQVVLYGESLGTGVAVAMAAEVAQAGNPVAAVLLEAPFTSTVDVAARHYPFLPVRLLMKDRFDSLSRIQGIQAPLFIAHGARDGTVPQDLGRKLFAAAVEPKDALWLDGAEHNDLFDHGLGAAVLLFLKSHGL
ncbi:MAG: alpha/beta hydrolase [Rhodospirillales bacterium]|nr:alpha/beta hydrolase [Rhodospirillales bacterium]